MEKRIFEMESLGGRRRRRMQIRTTWSQNSKCHEGNNSKVLFCQPKDNHSIYVKCSQVQRFILMNMALEFFFYSYQNKWTRLKSSQALSKIFISPINRYQKRRSILSPYLYNPAAANYLFYQLHYFFVRLGYLSLTWKPQKSSETADSPRSSLQPG